VVGSPSSETYNEARVAAQVEKDYVIGPAAARELEYRVGWQFLGAGNGIKLLAVQGDSVFVLDNRNLLTRIKTVDGNKLWRVAVADPIEEVQGVTLVDNRVFLTTGGTMVVLDGGTGSQIDKRKLEKIANTEPTKFGQTLIYGSRDGQAIWFSSQIGYQWRGYKVAHSINLPPVVSDNRAIVVGNDGTLVVLDAASASRFWSTKLLDQIVAPVAAGNGVVYVAGMDQYLWAFDLNTGRTIWKTLNESALMQPPTLIGDHVYQQIPHQGLVCFTAIPQDMPGGERVWASAGVAGNALFQRRDHVYAWDASAKRMSTLDAKRGGVIASVDLPQVKHLTVSGQNNNDIYAVSNDGRVIRLVPRN
jgi:outer membrane protein assembly factor BamB